MEIVINGRFLTQNITGVQRYARELVQALDAILPTKPGLKITVVSPRLSEAPPSWRNIVHLEAGRLHGHAWEQLELPYFSRGRLLFCPGNTAPAISLLGSQRVVVTVHDLSFRHFPSAYSHAFRLWYNFLIPLALRRADAVITVSEAERVAVLEHYPDAAATLHAIHNGCLPSGVQFERQPSDDGDADRKYILYVGSLSRHKNFNGVFEAARRLVRKRDFHFVFVGGFEGGIVAPDLKITRDASPNITFAGRVDDATLFRYYRGAACFLFPSFYEASGLPPLEAMAFGCPTVVSNIPALKERCGDAAIYCDPYDVESITAAVERVMNDGDLRARLQTLGYQRAASLTWEDCAARTLDLLYQCSLRGNASADPAVTSRPT
jgi:glycosyltransferase involved in cell wall biosynthesis